MCRPPSCFLGSLHGSASPVRTYTALLGAEAVLEPGGEAVLEVAEEFEHAILADGGALEVEDGALAEAHLAFLAPGRGRVLLANRGLRPARAVILGGPPFPEEITMWWNFVGRSHEEIAAFRDAWNAQLAEQAPADDGAPFGPVVELTGGEAALPAPALPNVRLRPRPGAHTPDGTLGTVKRGTSMTVQESERQSGKTEFVHADQRHRYEVHVGGVVAGFTQYREKEGGSVYAFDHTEVADGYSGMGLASKLVTYALDDVRSAGRRIRPYCPYVRAFIKRHQDYADLVEDGFVMDED
jgi:predicted GNAT family acetyltransferase